MQLQALIMVPVRGTVYIVKLPFVYVWRVVYYLYLCLYAVFASILRQDISFSDESLYIHGVKWEWCLVILRLSSECWKLIVLCFLLCSLPVFYAKKVYNRLVLTWGWTKLSARHSLGLSRTPGKSESSFYFMCPYTLTHRTHLQLSLMEPKPSTRMTTSQSPSQVKLLHTVFLLLSKMTPTHAPPMVPTRGPDTVVGGTSVSARPW